MKKEIPAVIALAFVLLISGCISQSQLGATANLTGKAISVSSDNAPIADKVEVFHFHGTHQCYSCIAVGRLAEKTVNTYFKDELDSGKIVFGHINGDLAENSDMVAKYGVTSASLWIGTYMNGTFHKEANVDVWYKINNEDDYLQYLKGIIEKRLRGEFD